MTIKEKFERYKANENKLDLIDKIMSLHPSYGVTSGWSEYTGGMTDTGKWYEEILLDQPLNMLEINYYRWQLQYELAKDFAEKTLEKAKAKTIEQFKKDFEHQILFGKQK